MQDRHPDADDAPTGTSQAVRSADLAAKTRALGHDVVRGVTGSPDAGSPNIVFSAASLGLAFALLREGAVGETAQEIDRVVHLPDEYRSTYHALVNNLHAHTDADQVVEINNAMFVDPTVHVRPEYLQTLQRWYGADVEQVDFPGEAAERVNAWVAERTHGRIRHLVDFFEPADVLALMNTVFLDAKWQTPFDAGQTAPQSFRVRPRRRVSVSMMYHHAEIEYAEDVGWQAVRLPYRGDRLAMWVLLPRADGGLAPSELLTPEVLADVEAGFIPRRVELSMPRWKSRNALEVVPILRALGMALVFQSGDFSGLGDATVDVSRVMQNATIDVGEKGTVASAATGIFAASAVVGPPPDEIVFTADHPFAFAVVHTPTGVPLFEGVVADPSE